MLCYLLFAAIYFFGGLVLGKPQPASVTKVVIETQTFIERQVTDSAAANTTIDPVSASLASLLSLLAPPPDMASALASAVPSLYLSDVEGPDVLDIVYGAEEGENPWLYELPNSVYNWIISEADTDVTILPQIVSLQSIQQLSQLASLSSLADVANKPFTTTITQLGRVLVTTAYPPGATTTMVEHQGRLNTGEKIGLGIGIPAFVLLLGAIAFVLFHVRRNRYRSRGVELYHAPIQFQAQSPMVPFPEHNELYYTGLSNVENWVRDGQTGCFVSTEEGPHGTEFVGHSRELQSGYVARANSERKRVLRPSPRNSYIQRKPVGSFSSHRVLSMDGVPASEPFGTTAGADGYMAYSGSNRIEDEGFSDAIEMPAGPVDGYTQPASPEGGEKVEEANAVKQPKKVEGADDAEETEKMEGAGFVEKSEKMEEDANAVEELEKRDDENAVELNEKQVVCTDGRDHVDGPGIAK